MDKNYIKQTSPTVIPTDDDKLIEEYFGNASTDDDAFSVAHMTAPPGWSEPAQEPDFDEITILVSGRKLVQIDGESVELTAGDTLMVRAGARVQYSNPFKEPAKYWSVCIPAFSPDRVHRD